MRSRIGLTYNLRDDYVFRGDDPRDANAEFDHADTIQLVEQALQAGGHTVQRIGNAFDLLKQLDHLEVDLVFNLTEGYTGRNRESQVPILLEMMGIPCVGSDGLTLGLTLDKVMAKKILMSDQIPTPAFLEISDAQVLPSVHLRYPLIVKPRFEGSSKGVSNASLVHDADSLQRQARHVIATYQQPALVEEFIMGAEFTVLILGDTAPEPQPVVQIMIDGMLDLGQRFYTFDDARSPTAVTYVCPSPAPAALLQRVTELAVCAYTAVECRDFGRVDLRVDSTGQPFVLEVNPLPSLSSEDTFMMVAAARGVTYDDIINEVVQHAINRCARLQPQTIS